MADWAMMGERDFRLSRGEVILSLRPAGPSTIEAEKSKLLDEHLTGPQRDCLTGLATVLRLGVLRREALDVYRQLDQLLAGIARVDAVRAEIVALAAPGWSARVAALDGEGAGLAARRLEIEGRLQAMAAPLAEARAAASRQVEHARSSVAFQAFEALRRRRDDLMAQAAATIGGLLDRGIAAAEAADLCHGEGRRIQEHNGDPVGIDALADEAARSDEAGRAAEAVGTAGDETAAPAPPAGRSPAWVD